MAEKRRDKAGSPLGGKMSKRKIFRQPHWLIELSPRKNVEPRIVGIRSTFRGSTFFCLVEIRLKWLHKKQHFSWSPAMSNEVSYRRNCSNVVAIRMFTKTLKG